MGMVAGLTDYLREIWRRRYFWVSLARMDLNQRYHGSVLGIFWSLLHPLCMTAILCFVFVGILKADPQLYVPFVLSGLAPWSFLSGAFVDGCLCVRQAEKFMRVYPAPIAIYALRTVCSLSFHFLVILGICIVFSWVLLGFGNLKTLIFLVPALALFLVFGLSVVQIFGILDIYFPDNKHIVQMALQMLFYMLPIIYPPESLNSELFRNVLHYNPLAAFILLIREPIAQARVPSLTTWVMAAGTTAVTLFIAGLLVRKTERRVIFHF